MSEEETYASPSGTFEFNQEDYDRIMLKESIFDEDTTDPKESDALTHQLFNLQEREIRQHLHAVTLSDYLRKKIIPRGLRLQKAPALGQDNPTFCTRWCEILNKCSFDLMALVISEITVQLESTREDFKQTEIKLKVLSDKKKLGEIKKELERHRIDCTSEIRSVKRTKFARDTEDYKQSKVYFWRDGKPESLAKSQHNQGQRARPVRQRQQGNRKSWLSSSSYDSGSDVNGQSERGVSFLGYGLRKPQNVQRWRRADPFPRKNVAEEVSEKGPRQHRIQTSRIVW